METVEENLHEGINKRKFGFSSTNLGRWKLPPSPIRACRQLTNLMKGKKMKKDLYTVEIPSLLTNLIGKGNMRDRLKEATQAVFADWAKPELVEKIKVTKPRTRNNHEKEEQA